MPSKRLIFRTHAIQRMFERRVSEEDVQQIVESGETIESYPDDKPYSSRLICGTSSGKVLHIVAADITDKSETIIITVYEPGSSLWDDNFKKRKK